MGATTCFAERRRTVLSEASARGHARRRRASAGSCPPVAHDAGSVASTASASGRVTSGSRNLLKGGVSFRRFKFIGYGRTYGLKRLLMQNPRTRQSRPQRNASVVDHLRHGNSERLRDESAASVLSDASTVPDEILSNACTPSMECNHTNSDSIWDAVFSKGQSAKDMDEDASGLEDVVVNPKPKKVQGTCVAIDCEMVGVGKAKSRSILARVAIVDEEENTLMDEYVRPTERITDFRTRWSGIRPKDLVGAPEFRAVRKRVASIVRGKILIGHAIANDLKVLGLPHPPMLTRDTSHYKPLRTELSEVLPTYSPAFCPSLKNLSLHLLGKKIQEGEHCPVQDAAHTMLLYLRHRTEWEAELLLA